MSCGNRFQCGLTKSSRFQFKPDKPSNPELHNENQKRLNDLLKARDEIDKQYLTTGANTTSTGSINLQIVEQTTSTSIETSTNSYTPWATADTTNYTPWKTPSTSEYQSKAK
jgi:uncharacterized protein YqiB (DUF1249 family)